MISLRGVLFITLGLTLIVGVGGSYVAYTQLQATKSNRQELTRLKAELASSTEALQSNLTSLESALKEVDTKNISLSDALSAERERLREVEDDIGGFEDTVGNITGSVKTLEKLQKTDPELLQKYSKVYFLNENFKPADLVVIDEEYDFKNGREVAISTDVAPFLRKLLRAADDAGVDLSVLSGYRSFDEQAALKGIYTVNYGAGSANAFSADQGYSEHQLGTAVDFTTDTVGSTLSGFDATPAYTWLTQNAYKYGFVLSYPKGNTYYVYEPWHWRFVGVKLATDLYEDKKNLYDLEQRKIDEYLVHLFDKS